MRGPRALGRSPQYLADHLAEGSHPSWHKVHRYFGSMFTGSDQPCLKEPGKGMYSGCVARRHRITLFGEKRGSVPGFVHVVDDDARFATAMERRLKHAGYEVAVYASAQELLDRFPSDSVPSCILLDVQIPIWMAPRCKRGCANSARHCRSYFSLAIPTSRSRCAPSRRARRTFLQSQYHPTTFFRQSNGRLHATKPPSSNRPNCVSFALSSLP
jgi:hypothetical protein